GFESEEVVGKPVLSVIPPDLVDEDYELLRRVTEGVRVDQHETVRLRRDGTCVPVSLSLAPVFDAAGKVIGASKTLRDLTAQKKAADTLRQTEDQLRHAQKMEAVGRLAGGIAHDFNNMLSV